MGPRRQRYLSDMEAVEQFLEDRYGYWSEDVEHADPFGSASPLE